MKKVFTESAVKYRNKLPKEVGYFPLEFKITDVLKKPHTNAVGERGLGTQREGKKKRESEFVLTSHSHTEFHMSLHCKCTGRAAFKRNFLTPPI